MKFSCTLVGKDDRGQIKLEQDLAPVEGGVLKIEPGFGIAEYFVEVFVEGTAPPKRVNLLLNGFEWINLDLVDGTSVFRSGLFVFNCAIKLFRVESPKTDHQSPDIFSI